MDIHHMEENANKGAEGYSLVPFLKSNSKGEGTAGSKQNSSSAAAQVWNFGQDMFKDR